MASGPETPGLACLMFSIPKRLPTPAPAWEPRAVGPTTSRGSSSLSWRAVDCAGLREEAKTTGRRCPEQRRKGFWNAVTTHKDTIGVLKARGTEMSQLMGILLVGGIPVEIAFGGREQGKLGPGPFSKHQEGVHIFGRSGPRGDSTSCHCSGLGLL